MLVCAGTWASQKSIAGFSNRHSDCLKIWGSDPEKLDTILQTPVYCWETLPETEIDPEDGLSCYCFCLKLVNGRCLLTSVFTNEIQLALSKLLTTQICFSALSPHIPSVKPKHCFFNETCIAHFQVPVILRTVCRHNLRITARFRHLTAL